MPKQTKKTEAQTPTTQKVTTGKKVPARVTNKLVIRDACAAKGCTVEPVKNSIYCGPHGAEKRAETAAKANLEAATTKLMEVMVNPPAPLPPVVPAAVEFTTPIAVIYELRRLGWGDVKIAEAIGIPATKPHTRAHIIWSWRKGVGQACAPEQLAAMQALLAQPAPTGKRVSKSVKKAAKAAYHVRLAQPVVPDQRQLMLDLRDALDEALKVTR